MNLLSEVKICVTSFIWRRELQRKLCSIVKDLSKTENSKTIYALSSGRGKCGVSVIRVSGPGAYYALQTLASSKKPILPRHAHLRTLRDPHTKEILDRGILLWFPGPNSFTGEDSVEFQVHGGIAVVKGILEALSKIEGLKPAEPGEFSKRAFYNGKLSLTEAEGIADLVHAETEMQRRQALIQIGGSLDELHTKWRKSLLKTPIRPRLSYVQNLAHVEAYIDFGEDDDIEADVLTTVEESVKELCGSLQNHLTDLRQGERLRDGVRTSIIGEPNVGKSSIFNMLCQRPASIVTSLAGTTRDIVEQYINIGGYPLSISDTAGLREESSQVDIVEQEGMSRTRNSISHSDLLLLVVGAPNIEEWIKSRSDNILTSFPSFLTCYVNSLQLSESIGKSLLASNIEKTSDHQSHNVVVVINKIDLIESPTLKTSLHQLQEKYSNLVLLSCKNEYGIEKLLENLKRGLMLLCGVPRNENPIFNQARHRHHLKDCLECLKLYLQMMGHLSRYQENTRQYGDIALCAEQLRKAIRHLGKVTGHVSTEQLLDVIFRDFCIGK